MKNLQFKISGMHCEACIKLINGELRDLPGIEASVIDFKSGIAKITADESTSAASILAAIENAGYKAEAQEEALSEAHSRPGLASSRGASKRNVLLAFAGLLVVGFAATAISSNLTLAGWSPFQSPASLFSGQVPDSTPSLAKTPAADRSAGVCPVTGSGAAGCPMMNGNKAYPKASPRASRTPAPLAVQDEAANADSAADVQTVRMTQSAYGYEPSEFTIKKAVPVKWIITSETTQSCAASIRMDDFDILQSLEEGENIIEFTPTLAIHQFP